MTPTKSERPDGIIEYRVNGLLHREDGPAVERPNGILEWFRNGAPHREDGPAVEYPNGSKEFYDNGVLIAVVESTGL